MLAITARLERDEGYFALIGRFVIAPMFLFSGALFPLTNFPVWAQWLIQALPLRQAIELIRDAMNLNLSWSLLGHVAYFAVMVIGGLYFTTRRLTALFLR